MEQYPITPVYGQVFNQTITVTEVPGSKSITNRALLLATLASGESILENVLFSDDSRHFLDCVKELGFSLSVDEKACRVKVCGENGSIPKKKASLNVGSAGTAARFLTALLGVSEGVWHMDSSAQMKRRPMEPLLSTLRELGCEMDFEGEPGFFPFTLKGKHPQNQNAGVNIDRSSQFLSALLIAFGALDQTGEIEVCGSHGMAYIEMTVRMMEQFGAKVVRTEKGYEIPSRGYRSGFYQIEPDVSAACYFYAMAAILGISVKVPHVHFDGLQGDVEFLRILERMGCACREEEDGITLTGPTDGRLRGIEADMHTCSDQAITLAAIAPFADSPVTIRGIGHIRLQESDRIGGMAAELTRMGIVCEELEDGIRILPGSPKPCTVQTYEDHRMAMGFSLTGLRAPGIVIADPDCCRKTFENYFTVLEHVLEQLQQK